MTRLCLLLAGVGFLAPQVANASDREPKPRVAAQQLGFRSEVPTRRFRKQVLLAPIQVQLLDSPYWTSVEPPGSEGDFFAEMSEQAVSEHLHSVLTRVLEDWFPEVVQVPLEFDLTQGRISNPRKLAQINKQNEARLSLAVTVTLQTCQTDQGMKLCLRGNDTAFGDGDPGLTMVFAVKHRRSGDGVRPKRLEVISKDWTYMHEHGGTEHDTPLFPSTDGSFEEQAEDLLLQALKHAWTVSHPVRAHVQWRKAKRAARKTSRE